MRRFSLPIILVGVLVVAITLAAFFLLEVDTSSSVNVWALACILFAEVVMFGGLVWVRYEADMTGLFKTAGGTVVFVLYGIIAVISALVSRSMTDVEAGSPNTLILIQLGVFVLFAVIYIGIHSFARGVERQNLEDAEKIGDNTPKRGGF